MTKAMEANQPEKLSYEQLKDVASNLQMQFKNLSQEHQRLMTEYNRAMEMVMGKRIECLFNVLKYRELFDEDFVEDTVRTLRGMLATPKNEPNCAEEKCTDNSEE